MAQWVRWLDCLTTHTSLSPIRCGFAPVFVNCKKGALHSQLQVIKFTSCLPMDGGSLRIRRLLPPLKLVAGCHDIHVDEILLKVTLNNKKTKSNQIKSNQIIVRGIIVDSFIRGSSTLVSTYLW